MTRQEKAERRELIKRLYSDGVTADVLAERFGISKEYIYQLSTTLFRLRKVENIHGAT